jgi:hypothetical protein
MSNLTVTVEAHRATVTLTRAEMTIVRVVTASGTSDVTGVGYAPEGQVQQAGVALKAGDSFALFEHVEPGVYEAHWLFTVKGRAAFLTAVEMLRYMFAVYPTRVVYGSTPASHRAARWFNRRLGATSLGLRDTADGAQEVFSMTRSDFEARHG